MDVMSQVIAMDLTFTYFNELSKELQKALSNSKATDSAPNKEQLERIYKRLSELRQETRDEMATETQRLSALLGMQQNIARLYSELNRGLPGALAASLHTFQQKK